MSPDDIKRTMKELDQLNIDDKRILIEKIIQNQMQDAIPFLLRLVADPPSIDVLLDTLGWLVLLDYQRSIEVIFETLDSEFFQRNNKESRYFLPQRIEGMIHNHTPSNREAILLNYANHTNPLIRQIVSRSLRGNQSEIAFSTLLRLMNDTNVEVKSEAYTTLSFFPIQRTIDILIAALDDDDLYDLAISTLSVHKHEKAIPKLLQCADDIEQDYLARSSAIRGLGRFAVKDSIGVLTNILENDEESELLRQESALALRVIGEEGIQILQKILESSDDTCRKLAKYALE